MAAVQSKVRRDKKFCLSLSLKFKSLLGPMWKKVNKCCCHCGSCFCLTPITRSVVRYCVLWWQISIRFSTPVASNSLLLDALQTVYCCLHLQTSNELSRQLTALFNFYVKNAVIDKQVRKVLWTRKGVRATVVTADHCTHAELTSGHALASWYSCCVHFRGLC